MPAAVAIPAIASVVGAIGGGLISAHGASSAANTAAASSNKALDIQKQVYDQQRSDNAPYLASGTAALGRLGELANQSHYIHMLAAHWRPK